MGKVTKNEINKFAWAAEVSGIKIGDDRKEAAKKIINTMTKLGAPQAMIAEMEAKIQSWAA